MELRKSSKKQAKMKLALAGCSGSGKTYSSLLLAYGMTNDWSKIAVIDTENGSADLYAHLGNYNVLNLKSPFTPERYIQAIEICENAGMEVIIIDSISHCWEYLLELHAAMQGNSFTNWGKITPRQTTFVQKILSSNSHIISTLRTKQDYVLNEKNGKLVPEKVGLKTIMRDGIDYEFTIVLDVDMKHKDNELTISHVSFIESVFEAAVRVFPNECISIPEIRVSHVIKGRTPDAVHKSVNELLDDDKTIYYERMAFVMEIPGISEVINGNPLNLTIGGVRSYKHENLYSKKTCEKFKVFIGFKNMVCCNMCISTDGYKDELKVMSQQELFHQVIMLFQFYNVSRHLQVMNSFNNHYLSEHQFAQLIGKSKLYQSLPPKDKKLLPSLEMTDCHINTIVKNYYRDEAFRRDSNKGINLWNVYNLFTSANKGSYIDTFLNRAVNATDFIGGISKALNGQNGYSWFIE